jgi:recombination protein RecT
MNTMKEQPVKKTAIVPINQEELTQQILVKVQQFIDNKELNIPKGYSPQNAIKSAYLHLTDVKVDNKPILELVTKESVANALLKMVLQGLSPQKQQCSFVIEENKLKYVRDYFGDIALVKRLADAKDVVARVIYEKDKFEYNIGVDGRIEIIEHKQQLENIDINKIKGAYAAIIFNDSTIKPYIEIMTITQINQSLAMGKFNNQDKKFLDQSAKKTVIKRACKVYIASSDDAGLFNDDANDENTYNIPQDEPIRKDTLSMTEDVVIKSVETIYPEQSENNETDKQTLKF